MRQFTVFRVTFREMNNRLIPGVKKKPVGKIILIG
jgi:ribosomal protein S14